MNLCSKKHILRDQWFYSNWGWGGGMADEKIEESFKNGHISLIAKPPFKFWLQFTAGSWPWQAARHFCLLLLTGTSKTGNRFC
jgi:hypothetical protein